MARTQAKVLVTIWSTDEWRQTPAAAQRLYLLLLSQSRLNLAGCIDLMPSRWAALAPDTCLDDVEAGLCELERRRFIVIDHETEELVVRTFTEHDLANGALNRNLVKGFWSAWSGILSPMLRKVVVDNVPEAVWSKSGGDAPPEAVEMHGSNLMVLPVAGRFEPQSQPQFEPQAEPSTTVTTTVTVSEAAATAVPTGDDETHATVPNESGGGVTTSEVLAAAAELVAEAETLRRQAAGEIGSPAGYKRSRIAPLREQHERTWRRLLEADPSMTCIDLARAVTDPTKPGELTDAEIRAKAQADLERSDALRAEIAGYDTEKVPMPPEVRAALHRGDTS